MKNICINYNIENKMNFPVEIWIKNFQKLKLYQVFPYNIINNYLYNISNDFESWKINERFDNLVQNDYFYLKSPITSNIYKKYIKYIIKNNIIGEGADIADELYDIYQYYLQNNIIDDNLFHLAIDYGYDFTENTIWKPTNPNQIVNIYDINFPIYVKCIELGDFSLGLDKINKIDDFTQLPDLQCLRLNYTNISTINNINCLSNLTMLEIIDSKIHSMVGIQNLINLQILNLSSNKIEVIFGLDKLFKLRKLNLSNNMINNICGLDHLINLQKLDLSENKIKVISGLDHLINLRKLDLSENILNKIENLENLQNLFSLYLNKNNISRLENLESLNNLIVLYAEENSISTLKNFKKPKKIRTIHIWRNHIKKQELILVSNSELYGVNISI
jgi:hypothetical protein